MLQKMRDNAQGLAARVLVGIIVFVLAVFGFGAFNFFAPGEPVAATVNDDEITQNQLLVEARAELDTNKRAEMYAEMQLIVRDDGGTVIPVFADFLMAASSKLAHGPVASNTEMDGLRVPERWWFA